MKILNYFLILLIFIFITLRFIWLDYAPPSLSNDEISIAYDAYSISKTLKDEHNHFLPISFQSHGTYKAPIAIYLSAPFTIILGNNDYSARTPSAIFGSLTILALYLLVFQLSKNRTLGLLSAATLALTPLNIYTSRMALEANIALFFVVFGLFLFFKGLYETKSVLIIASVISFALSIYSYHTEWGFIPLLGLVLISLYYKQIVKKPIFYLSGFIFLVLVIPVFWDLVTHIHSNTRASTEIIFKDPVVGRFLSNPNINILQKGQVIISVFVSKYSSYTNLGYIFFHGANLLDSINPYQVGVFLSPFIIPFIVGVFNVKRYFKSDYKFIYLFLLISPIIPALTIGDVNNIRNLIITIPIAVMIGAGIMVIAQYFRNQYFYLFATANLIALSLSIFYFLIIYFYHFPTHRGINYQYGYKQIAQILKTEYPNYQKIVIDPRFGKNKNYYSGVPHLYISYYTHLNPDKVQNMQHRDSTDSFDKYELRIIDWEKEDPQQGYLYIVPFENMPVDPSLKKIHEVLYPDLTPAFSLYILNST